MSLPTNRKLLMEHRNKFFVETGTHRGDAIAQAIEANFYDIRTIDIDGENIDFCKHRFNLHYHPERHNIRFYLGDSAELLHRMISDIQAPITFWLDAHSQFFEDEPVTTAKRFPLLDELAQIAAHPIKTHTILIDDWHIFYKDRVGYSKQDILEAIMRINSKYIVSHAANPVIDGILIAHF